MNHAVAAVNALLCLAKETTAATVLPLNFQSAQFKVLNF